MLSDWFELFIAHAVVLDGLLFPLFYGEIDTRLAGMGAGAVVTMLTRFEAEWFGESSRWTNAVVKLAAAESEANKARIEGWIAQYLPLARAAVEGPAGIIFGAETAGVVDQLVEQFSARLAKLGITVSAKG